MTTVSAEAWFRDPALQQVLALLNDDGGEARIVGGAVRNSLLRLAVADIDLATTLLPDQVSARAVAAGIKAVPTGIDHGTVTLVVDSRPFEVTTLRRDTETDGRHAVVAFGTDWQADAERRDLTINALYADRDGHVIDLVGGLGDIIARRVRFIGDADRRIMEDYLRILRFFRFFAWYGEWRPDADGLRACARHKDKLKTLSAERIWAELKKTLAAPDPGRALLWMRQVSVLTEILPESEKWGIDAIPGLIETGKALDWRPDPLLRLAAILPPDAERLAALAVRLKVSTAEAAFLDRFARAPEVDPEIRDAAFDRLLYRHGDNGLVARLRLKLASARTQAAGADMTAMAKAARFQELLRRAETFERPDFPLSGRDVMAAGVAAGPRVGEILKRLEDEWVERNFSADREKLLARLDEVSRADGTA